MITKFVNGIADFFIEKGTIEESKKDICKVGLDVIICTCINYFSIIALGVIINNIGGALLFIACFTSIRSYSGGYHAGTRKACWGVMCFAYGISKILVNIILMDFLFRKFTFAIIGLFVFVIFLLFVPIIDKTKKFRKEDLKKKKIVAILLLLFWTIVSYILREFSLFLSIQLFVFLLIISIMVVLCRPWRRIDDSDCSVSDI